MSEKRLLKAIGGIGSRFILEADPTADKGRRPRARLTRAALIAAALVVAIVGGALLGGRDHALIPAAQAAYEPDETRLYDGGALDETYLNGIRAFAARAGKAVLDGARTTAYSPTALYTALSMTAEMTEGDALDAVLAALGAKGIDELRVFSGDLWRYLCLNPNTREPGKVAIANSLWLNRDYVFRDDTLRALAESYCASAYIGDMQGEIPELAKKWVEEKTRGLLTCDLETDAYTIAALYSAIYFYDEWEQVFYESEVKTGSFFPKDGERILCNFLSRDEEKCGYYRGDSVTAAAQYFKNGGKMLFILPDQGVDVGSVLDDGALVEKLMSWETLEKSTDTVRWWIPCFTMKDTIDLEEGFHKLGLSLLMDSLKNPLSRLSIDTPAHISAATHGTAISIDRIGCEAASYVEIMVQADGSASMDEPVWMNLNRPFLFAILSDNDVPLFLGVINHPGA